MKDNIVKPVKSRRTESQILILSVTGWLWFLVLNEQYAKDYFQWWVSKEEESDNTWYQEILLGVLQNQAVEMQLV